MSWESASGWWYHTPLGNHDNLKWTLGTTDPTYPTGTKFRVDSDLVNGCMRDVGRLVAIGNPVSPD